MTQAAPAYKQPVSALVVIYTLARQVLLLERADFPGSWQSVTGSREGEEPLLETARRELLEETGLQPTATAPLEDWGMSSQWEIYSRWRHRYAPGVTHNTEHVFGLCLPAPCEVRLAPREHLGYVWLPWQQAAGQVFSPSNADAIRRLSGQPLRMPVP